MRAELLQFAADLARKGEPFVLATESHGWSRSRLCPSRGPA